MILTYFLANILPLQTVCGSCRRLTEVKEHRGPQVTVEYGAYEARILCEMLLKGSVVITEVSLFESIGDDPESNMHCQSNFFR